MIGALVYATGANTYFGKTAELVQGAQTVSHFQRAVLKIGNYLIILAVVLVATIIAFAIFRGDPILTTLQFALVLTVAAIPVAMPTMLSVTMAVGARLLAKKKAIVTRLVAIEELAGVDVLCADKTGTLTQNKLTLGDPFSVNKIPAGQVILAAALASRADNNDTIDLAVLGGLKNDQALKGYKLGHFQPFDPVQKRTEAAVTGPDGKAFKVTKGAPQVILALSADAAEVKPAIDKAVNEFAARGFRSLGVARADGDGKWRFLGVLPLFDPPREDAKATIATARQMGVKVKMVTGDALAIAQETAKKLGMGTNILDAGGFGDTKHQETAQLADSIEKADGFAQVFPEHKFHIVDVLQKRGHIVGMTGDGVNDAPALKKADCGIAVSSATDAARAAAARRCCSPLSGWAGRLRRPGELSWTASRAAAFAWSFFSRILSWREHQVAGLLGDQPLPYGLSVPIDEADTVLEPHWAVIDPEGRPTLLVRIEESGVMPDQRGALAGWEATPHQRFERLLRENEAGVRAGILLTDDQLRLVYAPKGETSGWLSFPLRALATVAGRPMLGGLKLALNAFRLHNDTPERRLPALLKQSRDAQAEVSAKLAEQVLGSLHQLLRGLYAADEARIARLAAQQPDHVYGGLLTVLLRLVFLLYAEDRGLIPSATDKEARRLYDQGYGVRALHAKLTADAARYPDTMEERRGAWARLLVLFRLVHKGGGGGFIMGRGGDLFDPTIYPFLMGQDAPPPPQPSPASGGGKGRGPAPVSDGCILGVLDKLLVLSGERLSYRTLDVEQIGSVYETVMGFTVETMRGPALALRGGKNDKIPVFVDLAELAALKGSERQKRLKDAYDVKLPEKAAKAVGAAKSQADLEAALKPRVDERASPGAMLSAPDAPLLQPTDERRRTGSHYTPRTLTEPIVRHALEPALERLGPDAKPEEVLALMVCDPAMGSGAFLVEACRQLAARLVKAWTRWPQTRPRIPDDEDEELHAKRLVAQRCLYGVDKNPRAVELAKLSLWLATLAREHEFEFLDHALKCGDSLVGLDAKQIAAMHWDASKPGLPLFRQFVADRVAEATKARAEIQSAPDDEKRVVLEGRHRHAEARIEPVRILGDAVISAFFAEAKPRAREKRRATIESWVTGIGEAKWDELRTAATSLRSGKHPLRPFHWAIEFPEAFDSERRDGNLGFDAIVGNPPFAGKNTIIASNRAHYLPWLHALHEGAHGNADIVAHFYRRAFALLQPGGVFGLIATKTIRQGDTRDTGLAQILAAGGAIARATRRLKWPGEAAVTISVIHIVKGKARSPILDGRQVRRISAYLVEGDLDRAPGRLAASARKAFQGSIVLGMGFTFDDAATAKGEAESLATMRALIGKDPRNAERIFPYIGGEEVNTSPTHAHHRYVIDFADFPLRRERSLGSWAHAKEGEREVWLREGIVPADYPEPVAADWPELLEIVERRVKPTRAAQKDKIGQSIWWRFLRRRDRLYNAIAGLVAVHTTLFTAPHLAVGKLANTAIFANTLNVFANPSTTFFAVLQSRAHEIWARFFASTLEDRLRYTLSDCFETFPFPDDFEASSTLEADGQAYHDHRAALMVARNEGMTKTYNRFHDPDERSDDIVRLRELHAEMDRAVLRAYGWDDLADRAEPIFLDETSEDDHTYQGRLFWPSAFRDEVLARLLALNAERHAEEVRLGIAPGTNGTARNESEADEEQE